MLRIERFAEMMGKALDQYATERNLVPFLTQVYDHEKAALLDFIASYGEGAAHVTH